jgi:hypothetical protein
LVIVRAIGGGQPRPLDPGGAAALNDVRRSGSVVLERRADQRGAAVAARSPAGSVAVALLLLLTGPPGGSGWGLKDGSVTRAPSPVAITPLLLLTGPPGGSG